MQARKRSLIIKPTQLFIALALGVIFAVALYIRLYGNTYGLPYAEEADEPAIMDLAISILRTGDWNPHWFIYPAFFIYTETFVTFVYFQWAQAQGILSDIQQLSGVFHDVRFIPQPEVYLWARSMSALVGALTPLALYAAGARLYSRRVGLAAALFVTFAFVHVQYSHFVRTDIPLTLFVTVGLWFAANVFRRGKRLDYFLAGAAVGLAFASKFNGFPIFLTALIAHLAHITPQDKRARESLRSWLGVRQHGALLLTVIGAFSAFAIFNPFLVLAPNELLASLEWTRNYYGAGGSVIENINYYLSYLMFRGGFGEALTFVALLGFGLMLLRRGRADWIAVSFPLTYFVLLLPWNYTNIRSALPLTPFLALGAAVVLVTAADWVFDRQPRWRTLEMPAIAILAFLLVLAPVVKIQTEIGAMALPTTRADATAWLPQHLPPGARVLSEARGVHAHSPLVHVNARAWTEENVESLHTQDIDYVIAADEALEPLRAVDPALMPVETFPSAQPGDGPTLRIFQVPPQPLPLRFVDASLDKPEYAPGETAQLRAHWEPLAPLTENNLVFVRLLNSKNEIAYELAQAPQQGNGKMKRWQAGRVVTDTHTLALPEDLESGRYRVQLGFYRDENDYALPLTGGQGIVRALDAATLKIAPEVTPATTDVAQHETNLHFGDAIRLHGYTLASNPVSRGQTLALWLFWSADREMERDYTRFVHVKSTDGKIVAQNDGTPLGNYPTSVWTVGQMLSERVDIPLPADLIPGVYTLDVGWYEYPSLAALRIDGQDFAPLGKLEIQE